MGDLPLRTPTDRCLGGPLPRRQANQTHPHPKAINLYCKQHAQFADYRALIRLSPGCSLPGGRSDTRYSPVRRSPSEVASNSHAAPRLACVKPVASVHPEPGSNSPLYKYLSNKKLSVSSRTHPNVLVSNTLIFGIFGSYLLPV